MEAVPACPVSSTSLDFGGGKWDDRRWWSRYSHKDWQRWYSWKWGGSYGSKWRSFGGGSTGLDTLEKSGSLEVLELLQMLVNEMSVLRGRLDELKNVEVQSGCTYIEDLATDDSYDGEIENEVVDDYEKEIEDENETEGLEVCCGGSVFLVETCGGSVVQETTRGRSEVIDECCGGTEGCGRAEVRDGICGGSEVRDVIDGGAEVLEGGGSEVLEGGGSEVLEGGGSEVLESAGSEVFEGGGSEVFESGGSEVREGGGSEGLGGGGSDVREGGGSQVLEGGCSKVLESGSSEVLESGSSEVLQVSSGSELLVSGGSWWSTFGFDPGVRSASTQTEEVVVFTREEFEVVKAEQLELAIAAAGKMIEAKIEANNNRLVVEFQRKFEIALNTRQIQHTQTIAEMEKKLRELSLDTAKLTPKRSISFGADECIDIASF